MANDEIFEELLLGFNLENDILNDSINFLTFHNKDKVAEHSQKVATAAGKLAEKFGIDKDKALIAGLLHDIGNVIPYENMDKTSIDLGIEVFLEERMFLPILHQKLSKAMAEKIFKHISQ